MSQERTFNIPEAEQTVDSSENGDETGGKGGSDDRDAEALLKGDVRDRKPAAKDKA